MSHKHEFFFIHVEKVAGSSLIKELKQNEDVVYYKEERFRATEFYGGDHDSQKFIKWFGCDVWDRYYSFAFVRNPWDRMVSWWLYLKQKGAISEGVPLGKWMDKYNFGEKKSQIDYLKDDKGKICVDFIGRYENLQQDYEKAFSAIGFTPKEKMAHVNKVSNREHYSKYYDLNTRKYVERRFEEEIDFFQYAFEKR
jgi:hypothetical protein